MSYFKEFCESIHKTKAGYVPDLLDLESDFFRDLAMAAFTADRCCPDTGSEYLALPIDRRNAFYGLWEVECQDAIDAYNQTIYDERQAQSDMDYLRDDPQNCLYDPHYKYRSFNQAEIDAGFSGTGREFC